MIVHARRKGLDVISPLSAGTKISTARRLFAAAQNGKTKPLKSPISRVTLGRPGPGGCAGTVAPWLSRSGAIPWLGAERQIVRCLSSRRIRPPSDPARPGLVPRSSSAARGLEFPCSGEAFGSSTSRLSNRVTPNPAPCPCRTRLSTHRVRRNLIRRASQTAAPLATAFGLAPQP